MPRRELSRHRQECPFEEVPCKYARIGCRKRMFLKDQQSHESDDKQHLQAAISTVYRHDILIERGHNGSSQSVWTTRVVNI